MNTKQDIVKREGAAATTAAASDIEQPALLPLVDVTEDDAGITLVADLPGATRDSLSIRVDGDTLTLEAPLELGLPQELEAVYAEVRSGRYRRSFTLSRELDSQNIEAALKDGVLTLRMPKLEKARPRRIEVRAA
jgi:HSP20 family protein